MNTETTYFEKAGSIRSRNQVTFKLVIILILVLLLLIPTSMITEIIEERESLNLAAMEDVTSKWGSSQLINGPILTIPLVYENLVDDKTVRSVRYHYILPEDLKVTGSVIPEKLKRGIYEVVVYRSELNVKGTFVPNLQIDQSNLVDIRYDQAFLTIGISDLRGIKNQMVMTWNKETYEVAPGSAVQQLIPSGVTVYLKDLEAEMDQAIEFEFNLDLKGSNNLSFVPIGSSSEVQLTSNWASPSFNGNFLPENREVTDSGFLANWKVLQLNRNFPQSWTGSSYTDQLNSAAFGVDLLLPLDDYQKSMRSSKYAVMMIALTFLIFFIVEILHKSKIHPLQYVMVGLAICLFYILLVSITEHSTFNFAYWISCIGVIAMITLYSLSVFKKKKLALLLFATLGGIYGFLFVTLQLADYALLMGSLGLGVILALTMYLTRNVNWYRINLE